MTLLKHELRMGRKALAIWTAAIGGFIACCIFLFPEMAGQMKMVSNIFASMGAFTAAFGSHVKMLEICELASLSETVTIISSILSSLRFLVIRFISRSTSFRPI